MEKIQKLPHSNQVWIFVFLRYKGGLGVIIISTTTFFGNPISCWCQDCDPKMTQYYYAYEMIGDHDLATLKRGEYIRILRKGYYIAVERTVMQTNNLSQRKCIEKIFETLEEFISLIKNKDNLSDSTLVDRIEKRYAVLFYYELLFKFIRDDSPDQYRIIYRLLNKLSNHNRSIFKVLEYSLIPAFTTKFKSVQYQIIASHCRVVKNLTPLKHFDDLCRDCGYDTNYTDIKQEISRNCLSGIEDGKETTIYTHAELIMMKFIRGQRNNNAGNFILGISKQPCYLCHRYFEWINAHSNQKFIVSESHNKIYGLWDFPNGNEEDIKIVNDLHEKIETLIKIELTNILKNETEKREERMKSDSTTNDFSLEETNIVLYLGDDHSRKSDTIRSYLKVTVEDINIPRPGIFTLNFEPKVKWDTWNSLKNVSKMQASHEYIEKNARSSGTGGPSVSRFKKDEEEIDDKDKTIFDFCQEGNLQRVDELLTAGFDINELDVLGLSLLRWATDRGDENMIRLLARKGANMNIQDAEGQTALHYAASCGHDSCANLLLDLGTDANICDYDGYKPYAVASSDHIRSLFASG
ncbi:unnamed protein product [Didymodactylos carnosus]|uniref:Acyl-CoA-binding domain-containing protein 6 n=1 Tax=Didymodactylos carnosus TaxID=1234261 RepID=A0A8S2DFM5_9BILA|nr:unnamed protein product [Didymodactylos carnosus]CAF3667275.1 unnamed protein product [Didymodactylos carnosus]